MKESESVKNEKHIENYIQNIELEKRIKQIYDVLAEYQVNIIDSESKKDKLQILELFRLILKFVYLGRTKGKGWKKR